MGRNRQLILGRRTEGRREQVERGQKSQWFQKKPQESSYIPDENAKDHRIKTWCPSGLGTPEIVILGDGYTHHLVGFLNKKDLLLC